MADPTNSSPPDEPKKETVRISLPPRSGASGAAEGKRETVRITLPPKPGLGSSSVPSVSTPLPPRPQAPATTKIPTSQPGTPTGSPLPPPRVGTSPLVKPQTASVPSQAPSVPRPAATNVPPVVNRPTAPKKETARIQLPPEPKSMPKATVKLEQTQPLPSTPRAPVAPAAGYQGAPESGADSLGLPLSILAFLGAAAALAVQVMTYLGAQ